MDGVMRKGERTQARIVARSAPVFNTRGYFGTSMADIVRETGLGKGGIYNHFESKEQLALEAFAYSTGIIRERFEAAMSGKEGALERLFAVVEVLGDLAENPPVVGGCPLLNTAVEADDANPPLKEKAQKTLADWLGLIGSLVKEGISNGELEPDVDPRRTASVVVATLEGAVMMSKLDEDPAHMHRAVEHLKEHLGSMTRTHSGAGNGGE